MNIALCALLAAATVAAQTPDGNTLLARAGAAPGLKSYSAPVNFDVRMHRPLGLKSSAEGIVYFKAPSQAALAITKMPSILGKFFKTVYAIDLAPQVWPAKYTVRSVSQGENNGVNVYLLTALPKSDPSVDHVVFAVTQAGDVPVSASWIYKDGSSVSIGITNASVSSYMLPKTETVSVSMPQYSLDATVHFGEYALNAAVPDSALAP